MNKQIATNEFLETLHIGVFEENHCPDSIDMEREEMLREQAEYWKQTLA